MEILLVESDRLTRDQVKVGLQQFPEFHITCGEGFPGVNELRTRDYSYVFMEVTGTGQEGMALLQHLRTFDTKTQVVAISDAATAKALSREKGKLGIVAFLSRPIEVMEFFRMVGRLRNRQAEPVA